MVAIIMLSFSFQQLSDEINKVVGVCGQKREGIIMNKTSFVIEQNER